MNRTQTAAMEHVNGKLQVHFCWTSLAFRITHLTNF